MRFSGLAFDKVLGFVFALFVAKTYGSTAFGLYIFGVGLFEVAYAVTELGLERASIRAVADLAARGRMADIASVTRTVLTLMIPFGGVVALGLGATAPLLATALGRPDLAPFLMIAAVCVPASLFADGHLWATEGLGTQRYMVIVRMVVEPIVKVAIAAALFAPFGRTTEAGPLGFAYAAAIVTSAVLGYVIHRRTVATNAQARFSSDTARELLRVGLPQCGLALLAKLLGWWDVFLIFTFVSSIATTHYAVAYRTALLTAMIASAFDAAFRPRIASALALEHQTVLRVEFTRVSRSVLMLCLPALVMLILFPQRVMPVLGEQFSGSAGVVATIAAGTLVSYLVGPAASALTMSGRSRIPFANGLTGGVIGVAIGLGLVPIFGAVGVAAGQLASITVSNLLHAVAARRRLGVIGIGRDHWRLFVAATVAVGCGFAIDHIGISNKYAAFVVVGTTVAVSYFGTLAAVGIPPDDWTMLTSVLQRLRQNREMRARA